MSVSISAIKEPPIIADKQLFGYLQEMARQINYAMALTDEVMIKTAKQAVSEVENDPSSDVFQQKAAEAAKLRGLIQQTAKYIEDYVDSKEEIYDGKYLVTSDKFGELLDERTLEVTTDPTGVVEKYDYHSLIKALQTTDSDLKSFEVNSSKYIKRGVLYQENGHDVVGIAVGVVSEDTAITDENGYYEMSQGNYCATFTADKLAFWRNGQIIAYMTGNTLYISNAEITNKFTIGRWLTKTDRNGGLVISYQPSVT